MTPTVVLLSLLAALVLALAAYDLTQRRHAILRNFPVIGHLRYVIEAIGPELRQYIVTGDNEERPFTRNERRWVYSSAKRQNNYFGFGTDTDFDRGTPHLVMRHAAFPITSKQPGEPGYDAQHPLPCAKVLGDARGRRHAFRPASAVNISAMSFGSLSSAAVVALNRGAALAGALHNTGEGGVSPYHLEGGDLVLQLGTSYFGCRDEHGRFDGARFRDLVAAHPVRAVEIKLSQGAKPGLGGRLPAAKITPEIAKIRGIPLGVDCNSPSTHPEFRCVDELLDFVERLADLSGLPIGIKAAVGHHDFWLELAGTMADERRGVDFIAIDGGEGGTGAAPLVYADHVALPFKMGFPMVYRIFAEHGIQDDIVFVGSGKLGLPETALFAFALGVDMVQAAREPMFAIGCIQAQKCHTGHCPAGVATQNKWLMRGLDPTDKAARCANYLVALRKELTDLSHTAGCHHPGEVSLDHFDLLNNELEAVPAHVHFDYPSGWGVVARPARKANAA